MKFVEIYKLQNDGSQKVIVVCELIDGKAVCRGDRNFVENLEREGILDKSETSSKNLFPEDGSTFLEKLKFVFKSAYLNASEVKEK